MATSRAIIHLDRFRRNLAAIRSLARPTQAICLAVKANAYGHGAPRIVQTAAEEGIEWFAVATMEEALEVRETGPHGVRVLMLCPPLPDEVETLIRHGISCVVAHPAGVDLLEEAATRLDRSARIHLAVDTGMGRFGCAPEDASALAARIQSARGLYLEGVYTHFAAAESDSEFSLLQLKRFERALQRLPSGDRRPLIHAANSAGLLAGHGRGFDMVRPGILAYGYPPDHGSLGEASISPVMELVSKLVYLKRVGAGTSISYGRSWTTKRVTTIGTIGIGYGDGYMRSLSNRASVAIHRKRFPVVGRICMDQCMVDLGDQQGIELHDDAVLFGPEPPAPNGQEVADLIGTIPYEIVTAISSRVPRVYLDS